MITLFLTCFVALMAPVLDYKFKKVPTWLTVPVLAAGIGIASAHAPASSSNLMEIMHGSPTLMQTFFTLGFVLILFGPLTWKGGFAKEDLLLLLAVVSLNDFRQSLRIILFVVFIGFIMALFVLIYKGMFLEGLKASGRTILFQGKKREEDGTVAAIHKLTIPYSPAVACGVLLQVLLS